jgi:acid phosphatase
LIHLILRATLAAVLLVAIPTAGAQKARMAPNAPGEKIANLAQLKEEAEKYHACTCNCGCYAHDLDAQADLAIAYLHKRAAHNAKHQKLALVLDIDETTLTNYGALAKSGFALNGAGFYDWIKTASAPAIPGTLRLYKEAQRLGVSIFFLTGRPEMLRAATEKNLSEQGFTGYAELLLRRNDELKTPTIEYKSGRRAKIEAEGYVIAVNVGDQWSDLRGKPEAEYSVKYPNPYYYIP